MPITYDTPVLTKALSSPVINKSFSVLKPPLKLDYLDRTFEFFPSFKDYLYHFFCSPCKNGCQLF